MKNIFFLCVLLSTMCHASNKKYHYQFSQAFFPIPKGFSTEEGSYEAWWRLDYDKKSILQRDENYSAYVPQALGFTDLNGNRLAAHKEKNTPP